MEIFCFLILCACPPFWSLSYHPQINAPSFAPVSQRLLVSGKMETYRTWRIWKLTEKKGSVQNHPVASYVTKPPAYIWENNVYIYGIMNKYRKNRWKIRKKCSCQVSPFGTLHIFRDRWTRMCEIKYLIGIFLSSFPYFEF